MKKFLGLVVAFACVVCAAGCSKADFTCTGKLEGSEATIEGKLNGNQVVELKMSTTTEAKSEKEAEQSVSLINGFSSLFESAGIKMSAKASGKEVSTEMTIDVAKASKSSSAKSQVGFDLDETSKDAIIKAIEEEGLTCK